MSGITGQDSAHLKQFLIERTPAVFVTVRRKGSHNVERLERFSHYRFSHYMVHADLLEPLPLIRLLGGISPCDAHKTVV